jgi:hypothetical protein
MFAASLSEQIPEFVEKVIWHSVGQGIFPFSFSRNVLSIEIIAAGAVRSAALAECRLMLPVRRCSKMTAKNRRQDLLNKTRRAETENRLQSSSGLLISPNDIFPRNLYFLS